MGGFLWTRFPPRCENVSRGVIMCGIGADLIWKQSHCVVSIGMQPQQQQQQQQLPLCAHRRRLALIALTRMSLHLKREIKQHLSASARAESARSPQPNPTQPTPPPLHTRASMRRVFRSLRDVEAQELLPVHDIFPSKMFVLQGHSLQPRFRD